MTDILGPFETAAAAGTAVPVASAEHYRRVLAGVLTGAGVEIGAYDLHVMEWLTGLDGPTVAVIAGWISRANRTAHGGLRR